MIIKFRFNSKSSGQGVPEAMALAEQCKADLERNFYVITFNSPQDKNLEKLVTLVGVLKGSVVSIDNEEPVSANKFIRVVKCQEKLICKGICSHVQIGFKTLDQFLTDSASLVQDNILYVSDANIIKGLSDVLEPLEENRFKLNKSLFLSNIQEEFETEKKFCTKFDIEKIKEKINELPDEIQLEEEEGELEEEIETAIEYVLLHSEIDSKMSLENLLKCSKAISLITTFKKANQLSDTDIWICAFPHTNQYALVRFAFLTNDQEKLKESKWIESEEKCPFVVSNENNLFSVRDSAFNLYFQVFSENDTKIGDCVEQLKKTKEQEPEIEESNKLIKPEVEVPLPSELKDFHSIEGSIKGETTKAFKIKFSIGEVWIPKSSILSKYDPKSSESQTFVIEDWVLKKNNLV